jgi:hypothetical protein
LVLTNNRRFVSGVQNGNVGSNVQRKPGWVDEFGRESADDVSAEELGWMEEVSGEETKTS